MKTALSISSVYCNAKSKHINSIVMCPGHLVQKWKREIERLFPDAKSVIITDFNDLLDIKQELECSIRNYPLFLVISKDTAKISYQERPTAIYDKHNKCFVCPTCGTSLKFTGRNFNYHYIVINKPGIVPDMVTNRERIATLTASNTMNAFLSKNPNNSKCLGYYPRKEMYHIGKLKDRYGYYTCDSHLWSSTNLTDKSSKWVKHPSVGWLNTDTFDDYKQWYESSKANGVTISSKETKIYNAIIDIEENGMPKQVAPRRYSIARYIREKFKNQIDYFIADEVHLYSSGSSAQANAFGDLVRCAKKTIALTGTLLNGYADGIYYILYRLYSKEFKKAGYNYSTTEQFVKDYGVKRESTTYTTNTWGYETQLKTSTKTCPGVSPELFTNFLLDKAIFISLADMSNALPSYTETPIAVEMEENVAQKYSEITTNLRPLFSSRSGISPSEIAFIAAQKLNIYPDMPYDMAPIYDNKNGKILLKFDNAIDDPKKYVSNKDLKTLEIVREKIAKGENVLIYVNFINKTDVVDRLDRMFNAAQIKHCILDAKVKSADREAWIDKKVKEGNRVMICNPTLVETGLDLLAFTNIIFYQVGYNLFTMRQASRRSLRLNQPNNVNVYFLYYARTTQEVVLSLMANKLQAAMAIEGKFSEEGLNAMSNNDDILTQIADSLINNIEHKVEDGTFMAGIGRPEDDDGSRFTLVNMINTIIKENPYSILVKPKSKKTEMFNLKQFCCG